MEDRCAIFIILIIESMKRFLSLFGALAMLAIASLQPALAAEPTDTFTTGEVVSRSASDEGVVTHIRILRGLQAGKEFSVEEATLDAREADQFKIGDTVVVEVVTRADGSQEFIMRENYRLPGLGWLFLVFLGLAFLLGGRTSVMSVVGLLASIGILLWIVIPRILAGGNPMTASLLGCVLIACTSLYLAHGFSRRTSVALLSTILTLGISSGLAIVFVHVSKLFGMGSEEAFYLQSSQLAGIDLRGLLLGGILIGCLGVLDDITTAQTAAVDEIRKANPSLSPDQLRKAGFSVGKEHIASLINTLALAYVGASLPLLLLFQTQADFPLWVTLNGEFIAEEIVRTLVGSATLLIAVPISTWCASVFLKGTSGGSRSSHSHHRHA
jgi:uncharacterized membrane protein